MTYTMCTNLYVKDVKAESDFFIGIGFTEVSRQPMGDSETVMVAPEAQGNALLQIWDVEFIRQVSPEVADDKPSILFTVDNITEIYEKVKALAPLTNEMQDMGGKKMFNFQSPNGTYFAFLEV